MELGCLMSGIKARLQSLYKLAMVTGLLCRARHG